MMRWWLDRGVDGFRMDVINMISKDPALPDGPVHAGRPARRRRPALHLGPAHPRVPAGDAPARCSPDRTGRAAHRRRDAGRHGRGGARCSPTRARRGRHGVPVRARRARPGRRQVGRPRRSTCATSRRRSAGGRPGSPTPAGTACTGTTTTSRGSCPGSATTASTASRRRRCSRPSCTCTAGRRTSTRARSSA